MQSTGPSAPSSNPLRGLHYKSALRAPTYALYAPPEASSTEQRWSMSEMSDAPAAAEVEDVDTLGPVDWIVVEFPGARFDGTILPILVDLEEREIIRLLDMVVLKKDADGTLESFELSDLDASEIGGLRHEERDLAKLLNEDDVLNVANAVEPGSAAAILVWENRWAAPFGSAVRKVGGQLVASGRIPVQALLAAAEADQAKEGA